MPAHIKFKQELFSGLTTPSSAYTSIFVGKTAGAPSYNQGNVSARLADGKLYRVPYLEEDLTYATGKEFKGNVDIAKDLTVYGTLNWSGSSSDTFVTGGTLSDSTLTLTRNDGQNINIPGFLTLSGNTSGNCINELWVSTISGCSPVVIGPELIVNGDTYMNGNLDLCSSASTLFVHALSGCSNIQVGPAIELATSAGKSFISGYGFNAVETISGGGHFPCPGQTEANPPCEHSGDVWFQPGCCCIPQATPANASSFNSEGFQAVSISGGTTATTVMGTHTISQSRFSPTGGFSSLRLGTDGYESPYIMFGIYENSNTIDINSNSGIFLQSISGTTTATTLTSARGGVNMLGYIISGDTTATTITSINAIRTTSTKNIYKPTESFHFSKYEGLVDRGNVIIDPYDVDDINIHSQEYKFNSIIRVTTPTYESGVEYTQNCTPFAKYETTHHIFNDTDVGTLYTDINSTVTPGKVNHTLAASNYTTDGGYTTFFWTTLDAFGPTQTMQLDYITTGITGTSITILDTSTLSFTKNIPSEGILHKINMESPCKGPESSCGDSSTLTLQRISGTTTGTTVIGSEIWVQETLTPNTSSTMTLGSPSRNGFSTPFLPILHSAAVSGTTTGTTIMGSDSLLMNKSLATNVKTTTNIYPSYSQYSFSTTGMTGTSITSASKIYSSFKNNRFTNFIGAYTVTSGGGEAEGCPCTDQWCDEPTGNLCTGNSTKCGCLGPIDDGGGGGMYAIGSIDTVSGTTGTTIITPTRILMTNVDAEGTNTVTITSDGITMSNDGGMVKSQLSKRITASLNQAAVQDLGYPHTLIPAPGEGQYLNIMGITVGMVGEGEITPYATSTTIEFILEGAHLAVYESGAILLSEVTRTITLPPNAEPGSATDLQVIENSALTVVTSDSVDPTGGGGTLRMSISYEVLDYWD